MGRIAWSTKPNTPEKFWAKFDRESSEKGCWLWKMRALNNKGYPRLMYQGKPFLTHRLAFILSHGPIPEKMCVLHKCDNPKCANPTHLELGTMKKNSQDAVLRNRRPEPKRTHCPKGHEYNETNTYYRPDRIGILGIGGRECKLCKHPPRPKKIKTHCKNGHEWIPENLLSDKAHPKRCKICTRIQEKKYRLNSYSK